MTADPRYTGKKAAESRAIFQAWADTQPAVTRCGFCRWTHVGTALEGRDAYQTHRTTVHPEVKPRRIRRSNLQRFSLGDPAHRLEGTVAAEGVAAMHARRRDVA